MLQKPALQAHHDGSPQYVRPVGAGLGEPVELRLWTDLDLGVTAVHLRVVVDGEPHFTAVIPDAQAHGRQWWSVRMMLENPSVSYRFLLQTSHGALVLTGLGLFDRDVSDAHDFRLCATAQTPAWSADAVGYQIFCDRFAAGGVEYPSPLPGWAVAADWATPLASNTPDGVRQLYGGTLWGVIDHLDHLADLGIDLLYLTPFFPAESNHRYDSTTFDHVDPLLGGDEALQALCSAARERGIRVIGDLTLNHTGVHHDWFRTAQTDPTSDEAAFYHFEDDPAGPGYACFWGIPSLPKLDHRSAELRRRLYDGPDSVVARYVRDLGLSGWRIDVAQSAGIHAGSDLNAEVARLTRRTLDALDPDLYLVAEIQHDASAALQGDGWQGTMAYSWFTRPVWSWLAGADVESQWGVPVSFARLDGAAMVAQMDEFTSQIPWSARQASLTLLDSHDTARFHTVAGGSDVQLTGISMMMALPGIPMLFAGDEYGVDGTGLEDSRRPFPWGGPRDETLHAAVRLLVALRREHPALSRGSMRWVEVTPDAVLFERTLDDEQILVQVARCDHAPLRADRGLVSLLGGVHVEAGEALPAGPGYGIWAVRA